MSQKDLVLVGNVALAQEYVRYASRFPSPVAAEVLRRILVHMHLVVPSAKSLLEALGHDLHGADALHAAVCLDLGATLITNDFDFGPISAAGTIEVWSISRALREWEVRP